MPALSKQAADALYNHLLRNITFASPANVYLAMHASGGTDPVHPGKIAASVFANEVSYSGYQRQQLTFAAPTGTENATGQTATAVTFPELGSAATAFHVTGLSLWTLERAGTVGASGILLAAAPVDVAKLMEPGDVPLVAAGSILATFGQEL